jgi:hypothetical protein
MRKHSWVIAVLSIACSTPAGGSDTGTAVDAARVDAGSGSDAGLLTDAATVDMGSTSDAGTSTAPCGGACTPSEVCCAGSGAGDQCTDPAACSSVRCVTTADCTGGLSCCTDGIQSTCESAGGCFYRACATRSDCNAGEFCCVFGQPDQHACGTTSC